MVGAAPRRGPRLDGAHLFVDLLEPLDPAVPPVRDDLGRRAGLGEFAEVLQGVDQELVPIQLRASLAAAPASVLGLDGPEEERHGKPLSARGRDFEVGIGHRPPGPTSWRRVLRLSSPGWWEENPRA